MSVRRSDAHTKRVSNSFSIEAIIANDRKHDDDENVVVGSRNNLEEQRITAVKRQTSSGELDVDRLNRTHPSSENKSTLFRKPSVRNDDDDDGGGDDEISRVRTAGGRADSVSTASDHDHHHHHQYQQHLHHYQQHLQQFQHLLTRPVHSVMDVVHPLIRHNLLSAASSSHLAANDAILRRPSSTTSTSSAAVPSSYCCPPFPATPTCRPGGSRDDEMVPFYSWLLSRHGAFFNHRIHPAGNSTNSSMENHFPF